MILWETNFNKSIDNTMLIIDNPFMHIASNVNEFCHKNIIKMIDNCYFLHKFESSWEGYFKL